MASGEGRLVSTEKGSVNWGLIVAIGFCVVMWALVAVAILYAVVV